MDSEFFEIVAGASATVTLAIGLRIVWTNFKLTNVVRNSFSFFKALGDDENATALSVKWHAEHDRRTVGTRNGYHIQRNWKEWVQRTVKQEVQKHEANKHGG